MPSTALDHTLELLACAVGRRGAEQSFARLDRKAGRLLGAPLYGAGRRCHHADANGQHQQAGGYTMPKKDLIGPIVWALVKVPAAYHRLVLDIVDRLSGNEARVVHQRVAKALREKSAPAVEKPKRSGLRPVARAFSEGFEPVAGSPALFVVKKSVAVAATPARKTTECLVGEIYWPRDPEIDRTLPEMQPETAAASITVYGPKEGMTCAQMFRTFINVGEDVPLDDVGRLLKECGHVPSLSQLEQMVVQQERVVRKEGGTEEAGLCAGTGINLAPVEGNDGSVFVMRIYWLGGLWNYSLIKLDDNRVWQRGVRFLVVDAPASNP